MSKPERHERFEICFRCTRQGCTVHAIGVCVNPRYIRNWTLWLGLYILIRREGSSSHMKRVLVNGAGGFIGGHLVKRLKAEGVWVRGVDLKRHEYAKTL